MPRETRNSQDASISLVPSSEEQPIGPNSLASTASGVVSPLEPSPEVVAVIVQAVKASLAAEKAAKEHAHLENASLSAVVVGNSGAAITSSQGVPTQNLASRLANFLASGVGFQAGSHAASSGTPAFVVLSFVNMFRSVPSVQGPVSSLPTCVAATIPSNVVAGIATSGVVPSLPALQQPFIVGPGFSPIPPKIVGQVTVGKYIDLSELLSSNLVQVEQEP